MSKRFLKPEQATSQNLASAALDFTTSTRGGKPFQLCEVVIRFSAPVSETITISRDSAQGVNYDVTLNETVLVGEDSFVFRPQGSCEFHPGEEVRVQCTNSGGAGIAYVTIKQKEL